jgi:hypothetical protein
VAGKKPRMDGPVPAGPERRDFLAERCRAQGDFLLPLPACSRVDAFLQDGCLEQVELEGVAEFAKEVVEVHAGRGQRIGFDRAIAKGRQVSIDDFPPCWRRRRGCWVRRRHSAELSVRKEKGEEVPAFGKFQAATFEQHDVFVEAMKYCFGFLFLGGLERAAELLALAETSDATSTLSPI